MRRPRTVIPSHHALRHRVQRKDLVEQTTVAAAFVVMAAQRGENVPQGGARVARRHAGSTTRATPSVITLLPP